MQPVGLSVNITKITCLQYTSISRTVRRWLLRLRRPRLRLAMSAAVTLFSDHLQHVLADGRRGGKRTIDGAAWRCRRSLASDVAVCWRPILRPPGYGCSSAVWTHHCLSLNCLIVTVRVRGAVQSSLEHERTTQTSKYMYASTVSSGLVRLQQTNELAARLLLSAHWILAYRSLKRSASSQISTNAKWLRTTLIEKTAAGLYASVAAELSQITTNGLPGRPAQRCIDC